MKKIVFLISFVLLFTGCANKPIKNSIIISDPPYVTIGFYAVENQTIAEAQIEVGFLPNIVVQKWLELNALDSRFSVVDVWPDSDFLDDEPDRPSSFPYLYGGYEIFFSDDIEAFFQSDTGELYREALHRTIDSMNHQAQILYPELDSN